ncbi:HET-domain-containing protein [Annulohypoxylon maeteangense]|uniref:HET-domain-containing protein n=1 Tax=Annulohypoxylon maeteangense TaxID=1927788 RepID=UPI002008569F|nr:HET-domain-containing protein [Annulohypoxylon maeteangense]KAI0889154.1 HET-domain-containing protein [Annulohypoxylon maeteangense]
MSTESGDTIANRGLCQQCKVLFSREGFEQLLSTNRFKHSRLGTFPSRAECRFCSYLWNEDFIGDSSQVYAVHCLRDLVHPVKGRVKLGKRDELLLSWVIISRPQRDRYIIGMNGSVSNLESLTIDHDSIQAKGVDRLFITVESDSGRPMWQAWRALRLLVPKDNPVAAFTNFRPVEWNGLTEEWASDIKALLECCRVSHPQCQPCGPTRLPSRVLHITENGEPFPQVQLLVTIERQTGYYTALSYCWGGPQPFQLTKSNLRALQGTTIESNLLPQTLKDAVRVTHLLGLRYLWIDALCIVQDDPEDKKREISKMCAIYQNAFVTIAAATSNSVSESFLDNASAFSKKHATCTVNVSLGSEDRRDPTNLNEVTVAPVHIHKTDAFPLNKRGWTFQEALLPTRLLVFGDLEPFVRCRTRNIMKKSWSMIDYSIVQPQRLIDSVASKNATESGLFVDAGGDLDSIWRVIVEQYTLRDLSFAEDRPLAIGGVVDFLSEKFGDECYFGVWKSSPVMWLMWKSVAPEERKTIPGLPTWSWMSITGPIDLDSVVYFKSSEGVVEWDSDPSHARLLVSCCILTGEEVYNAAEEIGSKVLIDTWSDFAEDTTEYIYMGSEETYFLVLGSETNGHFLGIVAARYEGNVYHRCGLAELNVPENWRSRPREQIILT